MNVKIKQPTLAFIRKAKVVHGSKYLYDKVGYTKAIEKVVITCPTHGEFMQTPNNHLRGSGCRRCSDNSKPKWTNEFFLQEVLRRNKNVLPYKIIGGYKGASEKILVRNKYGDCSIRANHILNGVMPGIESAIDKKEYWKNQATEIHGDTYDYSKVMYINSSSKVTIVCKNHGEFLQTPNSHLSGRGCGKCTKKLGGLRRSEKYSKEFKDKANKVHNNKYIYRENCIFSAKEFISIICPTHGKFLQVADNHLKGNSCKKCGVTLTSERMKENSTGWSYVNWEKAAEKSKSFDAFKVYIIRCWSDKEEFFKIGRTFKKVRDRFKYKSDLPYNYEKIAEINSEDVEYICKVEQTLKNCNKKHKYIPLLKFGGRYECFNKLDIECFNEYNLNIEK